MTYATRRRLFFASVLAFLALSVPIILYTFGYRFSLSEFSFRKTGGIFVHAQPAAALITIDGRSIAKTTSLITGNAFIQNLPPGNYTISVSKTGSQTWQKTLPVHPQSVTEMYPLLMPANPVLIPADIASSSAAVFIPESPYAFVRIPDSASAYYQIYNMAEERIVPYVNAESRRAAGAIANGTIQSWNRSESSIVIETAQDWFLLQRAGNAIQLQSLFTESPLSKLITKKPARILPNPNEDSAYFILTDGMFYRWNARTETLQQTLQSIAGFLVSESRLIVWDAQSGLPYRTFFDTTNAEALATSSVADIRNAKMLESDTALAVLAGTDMWIIPAHTKEPRHVAARQNSEHTLITDAYVLWWTESAITIYWTLPEKDMPVFQRARSETIYETKGKIRTVAPYPGEQYIVFQEDGMIYALELDGRGVESSEPKRNKQALYSGTDPVMHISPDRNVLDIFDNGSLVSLLLP